MSLDQDIIKNKMIGEAPAKKVFTFPGDGIWHPQRIEAATVAEAEAIYHQIKRLIAPNAAPLSTPEQKEEPEDVQ